MWGLGLCNGSGYGFWLGGNGACGLLNKRSALHLGKEGVLDYLSGLSMASYCIYFLKVASLFSSICELGELGGWIYSRLNVITLALSNDLGGWSFC